MLRCPWLPMRVHRLLRVGMVGEWNPHGLDIDSAVAGGIGPSELVRGS
jgi:hypothetical protein